MPPQSGASTAVHFNSWSLGIVTLRLAKHDVNCECTCEDCEDCEANALDKLVPETALSSSSQVRTEKIGNRRRREAVDGFGQAP